jgi:hypothetical protein
MKSFLNTAAKFTATLNLIAAVATGKGIDNAVVIFNSAWN